MNRSNRVFDEAMAELSDRHRDEVLTAYAAVEHAAEPVHEATLAGLRDATLRRSLQELLHRTGRILVAVPGARWTSGYRDDVVANLTAHRWQPLPALDRAVLVVVLVNSVAIPRSRGGLDADTWISAHPTSIEEIRKNTQLRRGEELKNSLGRLRAAGLLQLTRGQQPGYIPGPQFWRLTPAARARLQEELILAAAPDSPLAAAIRTRRTHAQGAS